MSWADEPFLLLPADGLLLVDGGGQVVHVSKTAVDLLGSDCPVVGDAIAQVCSPLAHALNSFTSQDQQHGPTDVLVRIGHLDHVVRLFRSDDGLGVGILGPIPQRAGGGPNCNLYERVLGSVNEMVVVTTAEPIDRPGPVIVYVNEAFLRLTGFPRSEVLGRSPRFLQAPQADPGSRREFREKLASWQSGRVEIDNYTKDGSKYWVEIDFSPVADDAGWFTNWVSVQTIVTDRRSAQQRLQESETRYRLLAENSSDVIVSYGVGGLIRWVSPSLTVTLGWSAADWVGCRMTDFIHPADVDRVVSDRQRMNTGELPSEHGQWVTRFRVRAANGHYHWIETHARDASGIEGLTDGAVVSFRRVDREVQAELELQRRATYDDLTGAFKRDEALSRLDAASTQVRRRGEELAVLFCDIDLLKDVNDARGHAAGDELLRVVAERIRGAVRVSDTVARMGGDEFLVVLDGLHSLAEAVLLAEQIRTLAAGPVPMPGGSVRATVSVGVTLAAPGEGADAMMARADRAMYLAKQGGRNRVVTLYVDEESGAGAD